ncbi:MAG TPA: hypothetical protein VIC26_15355 [Marinagarivorans sp.]
MSEASAKDLGVIRFSDFEQANALILRCCQSAIRHVDIFSQSLDPALYSQPAFIDALSLLARTGRQSRIRLLVQDSRPLHGRHHPLITLVKRLPSTVFLRVLHNDYESVQTGYCISDARALLYFNQEANCEGFYCQQARAEARHTLEAFNRLWEHHSRSDPEFRTLSL